MPTDSSWKISKLISLERWWSWGLILKTNGKSEGIDQKSSNDEVSEFVILSKKEVISEYKKSAPLPLSQENAYIVYMEQLLSQ